MESGVCVLCIPPFENRKGRGGHRRGGQSFVVFRSITLQILGITHQQHPYFFPCFVQLARNYESITTVVALAANHAETFRRWKLQQCELHDCRPRVLHQRE